MYVVVVSAGSSSMQNLKVGRQVGRLCGESSLGGQVDVSDEEMVVKFS